MNKTKNLICIALVFATLSVCILPQASNASAVELTGKEKTLAFLSDVAMLDLSKYTVTLRSYYVTYPSEYGGVAREDVRYILENDEGKLDATLVFINGTFSTCLLGWLRGSPVYTQPQATNLVDVSKGVLDRYQAYYAGSSTRSQPLRNMLDSVSKAENTNVTSGSFNLEVRITGPYTTFRWTFNGIETNLMSIALYNETLYGIIDHWSLFTFSNAEVTVSKEQAIDIAVNRAKAFSWTVNGTAVSGFTVLREQSTAELTMNAREPLVLYPLWSVKLALDKTYPGGVSMIAVGVWADTGEVSYIQELSYGGGDTPPSQSTDTPSETSDPSQSTPQIPDSASPPSDGAASPDQTAPQETQPTDTSTPATADMTKAMVFTAAIVGALVIAAVALLLKKRHK